MDSAVFSRVKESFLVIASFVLALTREVGNLPKGADFDS